MSRIVISCLLVCALVAFGGCSSWWGKSNPQPTPPPEQPAGTPPPIDGGGPGPVVTPMPTPIATPAPVSGSTRAYIVKRDQLGSNTRAKDIKALNPEVTNWDVLKVGQTIKLPAK